MALLIMLPVVVFDIWLLATTGRTQFRKWARPGGWPRLAGTIAAGIALGIWLAFFVAYRWGQKMRVTGFPIPDSFLFLQSGAWVPSDAPRWIPPAARVVNLLSGMAATMVPFKFAEFLRSVKAELAR